MLDNFKTMNLTDLGKAIKDARKKKGWTQKELALKAGINVYAVSRMERGIPEAGLRMYDKVARVLQMRRSITLPVDEFEKD